MKSPGSRFVDTRLGDHPLWYTFERDDLNMRISDDIKNCVVFLGRIELSKNKKQMHFVSKGTGFLTFVGDETCATLYLVTAKHVLDELPGKFHIRINTQDGRFRYVASEEKPRWYFHLTDKDVDVAVYPWVPPDGTLRQFIPPKMFLDSEDKMQKLGIGIGDDVLVVGLFSEHEGRTKNEPIVRTGNIAMMPTEKLITNYGHIDAFLIESRSLGGMSGCPVFVHQYIPLDSSTWDHKQYFLGLMLGHWDIPKKQKKDMLFSGTRDKDSQIDMGIAVVVPAKVVLEVINHPELSFIHKAAVEQHHLSVITRD
jgi:hypothetical protein